MNQNNQTNQTGWGRQAGRNQKELQSQERIDAALEELVKAVIESTEYKRYQDICEKVRAYPQLEQQIHAYRKQVYDIQNFTESRDLYEQVDKLEREGVEFRRNPLVSEYLAAELAFCRLYQHINWSIIQNINFDVGLVDE